MKTPHYCSASYVQSIIRASRLPLEQALAGSCLSGQDLRERDYIDAQDFAILLRNVEQAEAGRAWAARMGTRLGVATHGPLGFAALSAATLGSALQVMAEFHAVRVTSLRASLRRDDTRCVFGVQDLTGMEDYGRWVSEIVLKVVETLIETVVGHSVGENVLISFAHSRPVYAEELAQIYGAACCFDAPETTISIPASWWDIRSPFYDEVVYRTNIARCREIVAALGHGRDPEHQVRNLLARHFDQVLAGRAGMGKPPGLEQLAAAMHITPRTLIRRLKEAGSSYKELLETAQKHCVEQLLQQSALSITDVAYRLGYKDPANFGRAFRLWYGTTPAAWRRGRWG